MKIIEPSVKLFDFVDTEAVMKKLEMCGRVSHQSGGRPLHTYGAKGRAESFVRMLIKRGHESVLEHVSLTFHIICDRAIMAELTRHRHASFTVESTRYVKYDELIAVETPSQKHDHIWMYECIDAEAQYQTLLLDDQLSPEIARAVLPLCLKSELYMTANLRELRHILKLRCAKAAHPQMRVVAGMILDILREKLPVIVEDISDERRFSDDSCGS